MGNSTSPTEAYEEKISTLAIARAVTDDNAASTVTIPTTNEIAKRWSMDLLLLIAAYSHRTDQINLITVVLNTEDYQQDLLPSLKNLTVNALSTDDITTIKNANIQSMISNGFYFYFNHLHILGNDDNIDALRGNTKNEIFAFLHFIHFGQNEKKKKLQNNGSSNVQIDKFIETLHGPRGTVFMENEVYCHEEDKLENISYKISFEFQRFDRKNGLKNVPWNEVNTVFLQHLIGVMMNQCDDKKKFVDYYGDIDVEGNGVALHVLSGCDLFAECTAYSLTVRSTKQTKFVGTAQPSKGMRKAAKVAMSTTKTCYMTFFDADFRGCSLLKLVNDASKDHPEMKVNYGKKVSNMYVDSVMKVL